MILSENLKASFTEVINDLIIGKKTTAGWLQDLNRFILILKKHPASDEVLLSLTDELVTIFNGLKNPGDLEKYLNEIITSLNQQRFPPSPTVATNLGILKKLFSLKQNLYNQNSQSEQDPKIYKVIKEIQDALCVTIRKLDDQNSSSEQNLNSGTPEERESVLSLSNNNSSRDISKEEKRKSFNKFYYQIKKI